MLIMIRQCFLLVYALFLGLVLASSSLGQAPTPGKPAAPGQPGKAGAPGQPQQNPNRPPPPIEHSAPAAEYAIALTATLGILVIVCMPSRKR
jgi:hypothetical protein